MKKITLIIFLLLNIMNCSSQGTKKETTQKKDSMEYFNIKKFLENNPNSDNKEVFLENGIIVRQIDMGDYYAEDIKQQNSPYEIRKAYFKRTGALMAKGTKFYGFIINTWKEYNEKGDLIKETNWDKDYDFSVDDLIKNLKEEYNINLLDINEVYSINRNKSDEKIAVPTYEVSLKNKKGENIIISYLVNGKTGVTLFETTFNIKKRDTEKGTIKEQYLNSIKKEEGRLF